MSNQTERPITVDDLQNLDIYSDPQLAPDGCGYAFVSTNVKDDDEYESHLFFQNLTDTEPCQWTFYSSLNSHPRFSPDGTSLIFQSDRSGLPQIWLMSTNGGEAKQLTTFKNGATNPEWAQDGQSIIFTAMLEPDDDVLNQQELSKEEREQEAKDKNKQPLVVDRLKYKAEGSGFRDAKRTQIVQYNIAKTSFRRLTSAENDHHFLDITRDGQTILFAGNLNEDADWENISDIY